MRSDPGGPSTHDKCYWLRLEDGEDVMIPMCMGCAVNGPTGCTCDTPSSRIESAEDEAERLREKLHRREERYGSTLQANRELRQRIRELERNHA